MDKVPFDELPEGEARLLADAIENWKNWAREWPYPVLGLVEPAPWPRLVREIGRNNGWLVSLCLTFGDPDPDIETGTLIDIYHCLPPTRQNVDWLVGVRTWPPRERQKLPRKDTEVIIQGEAVPGHIVSHGDSVGLQCTYGPLEVTVVARVWSRWPIELQLVEDILVFVRGREKYLEEWHRRQASPP